jgi:hypothetical protein
MTKDERLDTAPACAKFDIWFFSGASKLRVILGDTEQDSKHPAAFSWNFNAESLRYKCSEIWEVTDIALDKFQRGVPNGH